MEEKGGEGGRGVGGGGLSVGDLVEADMRRQLCTIIWPLTWHKSINQMLPKSIEGEKEPRPA